MITSPFCSCVNRKYQGDPHEPGCILGYGFGGFPSYSKPVKIDFLDKPVKCTCGNADDKTCKTDAHSTWCDGLKARRKP